MSSNVGSSLFIGLAGQAAIGGIAVGGYEWNVRIFICKKDLLFFFSNLYNYACWLQILIPAHLQTKAGEVWEVLV